MIFIRIDAQHRFPRFHTEIGSFCEQMARDIIVRQTLAKTVKRTSRVRLHEDSTRDFVIMIFYNFF